MPDQRPVHIGAEVVATAVLRKAVALVVSGNIDDFRSWPINADADLEADPKPKSSEDSLGSRNEPAIRILGDTGRHLHVDPVIPRVANEFSMQSPFSVSSTSVPDRSFKVPPSGNAD